MHKNFLEWKTDIFPFHKQIFCYWGKALNLSDVFNTLTLKIDIDQKSFQLYEGDSPSFIKFNYLDKRSTHSFNTFFSDRTTIKMNPFWQTCIGIDTKQSYTIELSLIRCDPGKIVFLILACIFFFDAKNMVDNPPLTYVCGLLIGVLFSPFVLIYFLSKLFPATPTTFVATCVLTAIFSHLVFINMEEIKYQYPGFVVIYILVSGLIGFSVSYQKGPITNPRTKNLIKWGLQVAAIVMVCFSSQNPLFVVGVILLMLLANHFEVWKVFERIEKKYV